MPELRYWVGDRVREIREFFEDEWFDRSRGVRTARNVSREAAGISVAEFADSEAYQPARPRHIRHAISLAPIGDPSRYVYVDLGSGKGRTLFIAAEFPFQEVIGVELSRRLHERTEENIRSFRWHGRRSGPIVAIHGDAKEFKFPNAGMVVYLFNPFGRSTTRVVLENLNEAVREYGRHVVLILLWPRYPELVSVVGGMRLVSEGAYYQIYEAGEAEEQAA